MSHEIPGPAAERRGLTLVEVILVLALLVVIGAVSAPLLEGSFSRAGLNSAADLLRGVWSKARLAAMQSGKTHVFRFEPDGSRFQIIAFDELGLPEKNELEPDDPEESRKAVDILRLSASRLPDGVIFAAGEMATSSQANAVLGEMGGGPWSGPTMFRPDGTTTDASIVLANEQEQTLRVTLRGLTGISNAAEIDSEAEQ